MQQHDLDFEEQAEQILAAESNVQRLESEGNVSLGHILQQARLAKKISVEDVADQLCLKRHIIQRIEADDYLNDKSITYMRGYIKSYARLVQIPESLVNQFLEQKGLLEKIQNPEPAKFNVRQSTAKDKPVRFITYAIIVILVVLVLIWRYLHHTAVSKKLNPALVSAITESTNNTNSSNVGANDNANKVNAAPATNNTERK